MLDCLNRQNSASTKKEPSGFYGIISFMSHPSVVAGKDLNLAAVHQQGLPALPPPCHRQTFLLWDPACHPPHPATVGQ